MGFKLHSPETNTEYAIDVVASRRRPSTSSPPAILFLDGDNQFQAAVTAYRRLRQARRIPELVLVGIGYGAGYGKPANRRGRDYTPTAHSDEPESGGADAFLKFLQKTLWPELERRYALHPKVRGIGGHSLGSLLVLHALWRRPLFFTHYLASAPSIWWDGRSILKIAARRRAREAALPARLFLSAGERDSESMLVDLTLLERQLAVKPFRGLAVTSRRFPKRDHYNVMPDAFGTGLATLLGDDAG
ncbi:MAG: alpha/beta hydrolase-fold protein [Opitutaceae bacterium]